MKGEYPDFCQKLLIGGRCVRRKGHKVDECWVVKPHEAAGREERVIGKSSRCRDAYGQQGRAVHRAAEENR